MTDLDTPGREGAELTGAGQLVAATRFAAWTGTSRERLRTWERRHGFPVPVRAAGGRRRYRAADAARVVAVRRAVEDGVPLADAIARSAAAAARADVGPGSLAAVAEGAPVPVAVVSGPWPLRLEWANAALRAVDGAPPPGAELGPATGFAEGVADALRAHLAPGAPAGELEHAAWGGAGLARSAVVALPAAATGRPLVALVGLEGEGEGRLRGALAASERGLRAAAERERRRAGRLAALGDLAVAVRAPGAPDVAAVVEAVARAAGAIDAALGVVAGGELRLGRSRGGLLGPVAAPLAGLPALAEALQAGTPARADAAARSALGAREGRALAVLPAAVAGQPLGAAVLVLDADAPDDAEDGVLAAAAALLGTALARDALVRALDAAAG